MIDDWRGLEPLRKRKKKRGQLKKKMKMVLTSSVWLLLLLLPAPKSALSSYVFSLPQLSRSCYSLMQKDL